LGKLDLGKIKILHPPKYSISYSYNGTSTLGCQQQRQF